MTPIPLRALADHDRGTSITERLAEVAGAVPDAVAVSDERTTLTYGQLERRATAVAARIVAHPGMTGGLVAVVLDQGVDAVVAMLGVLRAGCPYTFLDLTMPAARLTEICALAAPALFVSDPSHETLAAELAGDRAGVVLVDEAPADDHHGDVEPLAVTGSDSASNVVFTSGSTGQPKGVVVPHGAYLDHAVAATESMGFGPDDRLGLVLPVGFAAAALALHRGLAAGAEIHCYDPRRRGIDGMAAWMREKRVTYLDLTPTMLRAFAATLADGDVLPDLRVVTTAGEAVFGTDVGALAPHVPPTAVFINHAGSSETSGYAVYTVSLGGPIPEGQLPSGTALGARQLTLRNDDGTTVEGEGTGELCVTSRFVSLGYWGQPELTAERFECLEDGRRRYRLGDLAFRRADGVFEHRGRRDQMVKVRGYLVEPTEVEAALLACADVAAAAVFGLSEPGASTRLIAYVVPAGPKTSPASVRRALRQRLPSYMVPSSVLLIDDLPRNASGKIDRMALKERPLPEPAPPVPPRDHVELRLAVAWADILGVEAIGIEDDFFELGGDSLAAETAMAAVHEDFGITLPTSALLESPTVAELAATVRDPGSATAGSILVPLRTTGSRPPLFMAAGVGGVAVTYLPISLYLGPDQPLYVLQNQGLENRGWPDLSMKGAARRAVRAIRAVQAHGPYLLAGHSYGGTLAYEIARQLTEAGEQVAFLGLLDVVDDRYRVEFDDEPPSPRPAAAASGRRASLARHWERLGGLSRQVRLVSRVFVEALSGSPRTQAKVDLFSRYGTLLSRHYRRPPWRGPATVVTATDVSDNRVLLTWEGVLLDPPYRCSVPGDHRSLLREPHARTLAGVLSERIEAALAGPDGALPEPALSTAASTPAGS